MTVLISRLLLSLSRSSLSQLGIYIMMSISRLLLSLPFFTYAFAGELSPGEVHPSSDEEWLTYLFKEPSSPAPPTSAPPTPVPPSTSSAPAPLTPERNAPQPGSNTPKHGRKTSQPNILFIFQDDLGFGDLGCYGHPYAETPNLDKLANEGTLFRNFHVSGITCNPSRTGFMTSRHPASFPNYMAAFGFQGVPTVTEMLRDNGYTVAHVGKWHIGPKSSEKNGTYGIEHVQVIGGRHDDPRGKDSKTYDAAVRYLKHHQRQHNNTKPLYMNVWGHAAHMDVKPAASLVRKFKDVKVDRSKFMGKFMQQKFARRGDKTNGMMRKYLAEVWAMDNLIGKLLDTLDELGMKDNTIVVFSADQGPSSGAMGYSGGLRGEKLMQWEGGTRVPFIVRWPGYVPADHVNCHSAISALDFLPTLAAILDISIDQRRYEGEDVQDIWFGSDRSRREPIFHKVSSNNPETKRAMLYGKWKMHWNTRRNPELYDLNENPDENRNFYASNPEIGKVMLERLIEWDESLPTRYSRSEGNTMKPFDPDSFPTIIGPPETDSVSRGLDFPGINNPPLHEKRCLSETEVE